jgi:hypothetical protein
MSAKSVKRMKVCKGYHYHSSKPHPVIKLRGFYLASAGFGIGDKVNIVLSQGQILIIRQSNDSE